VNAVRLASAVTHPRDRYRLNRAGVLNVWQYDNQVFELSDGRLLLRGANGAGKSKTLEMLLPFALDGDKLRITASGQHHTSLLWLMTDGYEGNRTGYVWVEFARNAVGGGREVLTCGVGIRASSTARAATTWFFCCPRAVGTDLLLEDDAGPLAKDRCRTAVGPDGHFFESARAYKQHVGQVLFGLSTAQYDELLRLLYWLRQPQIGEDIAPVRLAEQLTQALPQLDDGTVRSVGDTFDELAAFGEQIERRQRAAAAISTFAGVYASYARGVVRARGAELVESHRELGRRQRDVEQARASVERHTEAIAQTRLRLSDVGSRLDEHHARQRALETSPEARTQQRLLDLDRRVDATAASAGRARGLAAEAHQRAAALAAGVSDDAQAMAAGLTGFSTESHAIVSASAELDVAAPPALPASVPVDLDSGDEAVSSLRRLDEHVSALAALRSPLGERLAAVAVVEEARRDSEAADARAAAESRRAEEAAERADAEQRHRDAAAAQATAAEAHFAAMLQAWQSDPRAVPLGLPELGASTIPTLQAFARRAASPQLAELRTSEAAAAADRTAAERQLSELSDRRRAVESVRDPSPPEPPLGRSDRDPADGAPLWRLVDFADSIPEPHRAGLEAALQASGLLDAWVRSDGSVLSADRDDVVLPRGAVISGAATLAEVLHIEAPEDGPVAADVVREVLARVVVGPHVAAPAMVDVDGSWRLGPLVGRASKPRAQYVGATARRLERRRLLGVIYAEIREVEDRRQSAVAGERAAHDRVADIESWLSAVPPHDDLLTAWARLDERIGAVARASSAAEEAEAAARAARTAAAELVRRLHDLGSEHALPVTGDGLASRRERLQALLDRIERHLDAAGHLQDRLCRWARDWNRWQESRDLAERLQEEADELTAEATAVTGERDELQAAAGEDVRQLRQRLADLRAAIDVLNVAERGLRQQLDESGEQLGRSKSEHTTAEHAHGEQHRAAVAAAQTLGSLRDVPGLLVAAGDGASAQPRSDGQGDETDAAAYELARGVSVDTAMPPVVVRLGRHLAALPEPARAADATAVHAGWRDAATSDAADHEPTIVPVAVTGAADVLSVLGRDDNRELPIAVLADRLTAAVSRDRELLTERERRLFEEHLIGDLGEVLRQRRLDAADLVAGMNKLLSGVTTSQGIAVRLGWSLREDVPDDARRAVELLGQPIGALLPDERAELRDALHRLIEASRAEAPEDPYTEHLARALDYRRWHSFRIRYTRPELEGRWQDLHRRSPLSQGEQKVVCYLPLFAAAAAHFESLAGAAPHAPRFVLLDDAFPKIDVRTHPLLFGLLVALDLDFVVTSERLWGDHETVPSLSIYEALRDPAERGIAHYRYTWDGARLQAVGA